MTASLPYNEHELLRLVSEGNEKAFRFLFDHHWDKIYSVAVAFTKSPSLSEEIVQDVFLKIWLNRDKLESIIKFDAYLFTVARNHIYNELRRKSNEQPFIKELEEYFLESSKSPEEEIALKETTQLINNAVERLSNQQRIIFRLSRYEGYDYNKIAKELGISKLTVRSHMNKALQFIRQYMQSQSEGLLFIIFFAHSFS